MSSERHIFEAPKTSLVTDVPMLPAEQQDEAVAKYPYHHRAWDIIVILGIIGLTLILWNILP